MLKDMVAKYALLKALADVVKAELDFGKGVVVDAFREAGASGAKAQLPDGTTFAKVSLTDPEPKASVADEAAWLAYVKRYYKGAVVKKEIVKQEIPEHVDPKLGPEILASFIVKGDSVVDPETGEVVPGLHVTRGTAFPSVRFEKGGRDLIAAAWREGRLDATIAALELPPATDGGE